MLHLDPLLLILSYMLLSTIPHSSSQSYNSLDGINVLNGAFVFASTIEAQAFSGFRRRIITLLVKEILFYFIFFLRGGGEMEMRRKENDVLVQVWKWVLEFIKYYFTFDEIIAIIIYLLVASLKSISVISGGPLSIIIVKLFCIQLYREEFIELHFRLVSRLY